MESSHILSIFAVKKLLKLSSSSLILGSGGNGSGSFQNRSLFVILKIAFVSYLCFGSTLLLYCFWYFLIRFATKCLGL